MSRTLNILAPIRYPWQFNGARFSRHNVSIRWFLPLNKISLAAEGVTVFNPFPLKRFDLVHAFNRIPLGTTPYIIGFESHLPRAYGYEKTPVFGLQARSLAGKRCRGIFATSEYARRHFLRQHADRPWQDDLTAKLQVCYPNIPLPADRDAFAADTTAPVRLVFVGNHFGRKGGAASVRLAALAHQRGFPVQVDIVSSLEVGLASWTDPPRPGFFDRDFALLRSLPNVRHHGSLPNKAVLEMVGRAHFVLLPTFSDSFGYSVIEAMARFTPAVVTHQGALPEVVRDGENGLMLDLENDEIGEWKHIKRQDIATPAYEKFFDDETDRLAEEAFQKITACLQSPGKYAQMRRAARTTAERMFSAADATAFWDDFYVRAVS